MGGRDNAKNAFKRAIQSTEKVVDVEKTRKGNGQKFDDQTYIFVPYRITMRMYSVALTY